ncbi:RT0821/Lpp0805 family surface protein [Thalassospira sp.]|uniref:RT0821/Lpp0805 family surface protein n=1 Tax=Thalassospira sp. TaxID=1912094 RepID=UPI002734B0CE|nr:glycine zipper 2TM domain-containing protein [Thalassospira sp.]MDP2699106.1 hypothetical protein [Thalassospira sp.]
MKKPRNQRLVTALVAMIFATTLTSPVLADPPPHAPAHGYRAKNPGMHPGPGPKHPVPVHNGGNMFVPNGNFLQCNRDVIGAILGGAAGAAAGSTIGKGDGRMAAVIGGAILGLLGGHAIGQGMDQTDQACTGYALNRVPDGQTASWVNPDSHQQFNMTPTRSWQTPDNRYCREYTATATIAGTPQQTYGTACQQPDGSWQIVS